MTADLKLAGPACNTYGLDLKELRLTVDYETGENFQTVLFKQFMKTPAKL
jgi:alpha-glucosidase